MTVLRHLTVLVGTAAAASALGIAALVGAGTAGASATDDTFITVLADEGIQAPSTEEAVSTALEVCTMLDEGGTLYDAVSAVSDYTELEMDDSAYFVGAAIGTYCPEHEDVIG